MRLSRLIPWLITIAVLVFSTLHTLRTKKVKEKWCTSLEQQAASQSLLIESLRLKNAEQLDELAARDSAYNVLNEAYETLSKQLRKKESITNTTVVKEKIEIRDTLRLKPPVELQPIQKAGLRLYQSPINPWYSLTVMEQGEFLLADLEVFNTTIYGHTVENTGLLGLRKKYNVRIASLNPYVTEMTAASYTISPKPKRWVVSVGAGALYDGQAVRTGPSIHVGLKLFEF